MKHRKQFIACLLVLVLLVSLCGCAGQPAGDGAQSGASGSPAEAQQKPDAEAQKEPNAAPQEAPNGEAQNDLDDAAQNGPDAQPQEAPNGEALEASGAHPQEGSDAQPREEPDGPSQNGTETKAVSLMLPFMETEDFIGFWSLGGMETAAISLRVPAGWTEEAGLFYCPMDGETRKVLEPVCLLRELDDAQWARLARFDVTEDYGETEYLSVSESSDANGRDCVFLLGKSWPEGGSTVVVWYPCTCYLRAPNGLTAVLIYYLTDPEDAAAMAEFRAVIDSLRFE